MSALPNEYKQQVIEWIEERCGGKPKCPMCGKDDWRVGEPVAVHHVAYPFPQVVVADECETHVCATILCHHCSYTAFFTWKMVKPSP